MRKLTAADVEFTVTLEQEVEPVHGHFATDEDDLDRQLERDICSALDAGYVEAWCSITVTATWTDSNGVEHTGHDHLGCCSHLGDNLDKQVEDTVASHGMKEEALSNLNSELAQKRKAARRLLQATR